MSNPALQNQTVLSISKLHFSYDLGQSESLVIQDLSLNVDAGEIISVLGASGCGKSTLLNLMAGLLLPKSGEIEFSANQSMTKEKGRKQPIGYIFQDDALFPWRTVESNLMLVADIVNGVSKYSAKELVSKYLKAFHLDERILSQYPAQLSGGMRQRISIMQTLMFNPDILLLDEPFSSLDFFTKLSLELELYQLIKEQNKAAILITHDIDEAIAISDRILIMAKGGHISNEFKIDFGQEERLPEDVRGTPKFAQYYHLIWGQLRNVIKVCDA
jgi:NitT/TauT family transport system ATP-binding protein